MLTKSKEWIWNVLSVGLPASYDLEILRKIVLLNAIIILGSVFLLLLGNIAFIQGNYVLGSADMASFVFLTWLFIFLRKTKDHNLVSLIGTAATGIFYLFLIANGGVKNTAYVWAFTYPLISLFLLGIKLGTITSMSWLIMAGVVFVLGLRIHLFATYSIDLIIRFIAAYLTIYLIGFIMDKLRETVQHRLRASNAELEKAVGELKKANREKETLINELQEAMKEVKVLEGIVPICAKCKKIRNDGGYWEQVEKYIQDRSEARFSHGICPDCIKQLYPNYKQGKS